MDSRVFTNADDSGVSKLISSAKQRLVFVSPAVSKEVADALKNAFRRNLPGGFTVILDVDPEVYRLGYGDATGEALDDLRRALEPTAGRLLHQPGIRLGLVVADDRTLIFSPTPKLVEESSKVPGRPNAILLEGGASIAPILEACGASGKGEAQQELGLEFASAAATEQVKSNLKSNPPKQFSLARIERVFSSALHYVEFEISDYRLQSRRLKLPSSIFGLSDDYLRQTVENTFKPFEEGQLLDVELDDPNTDPMAKTPKKTIWNPDRIDTERKRLKKEFLGDVPGFGVVVRRIHKAGFEEKVANLKGQIDKYAESVTERLEGAWSKARKKAVDGLLPRLMEAWPPDWRKWLKGSDPEEKEAREILEAQLDQIYNGSASGYSPTVRLIYKDVTYQSIHDPNFRKGLEKTFGKSVSDDLFSEYSAARESKNVQQPDKST